MLEGLTCCSFVVCLLDLQNSHSEEELNWSQSLLEVIEILTGDGTRFAFLDIKPL